MGKTKKPPLNESSAKRRIKKIMATIHGVTPPKLVPISKLVGGKLYELYVYSELLSELALRGWHFHFIGPSLILKASPGKIKASDSHIELRRSANGPLQAKIYVDVEVGTLGCKHANVTDKSAYHEIDIVIVPGNTLGRPRYDELLLGIECKATAKFSKAFVREVLGRRRELSYFQNPQKCILDGTVDVPAFPPSEYWFAFIDPDGVDYSESPSVFGIEFRHWQP